MAFFDRGRVIACNVDAPNKAAAAPAPVTDARKRRRLSDIACVTSRGVLQETFTSVLDYTRKRLHGAFIPRWIASFY